MKKRRGWRKVSSAPLAAVLSLSMLPAQAFAAAPGIGGVASDLEEDAFPERGEQELLPEEIDMDVSTAEVNADAEELPVGAGEEQILTPDTVGGSDASEW